MESESIEIAGRKITKADWDATPESVKLVIEDFHGIIGVLTLRVSNLEEKLNKNSKNSSIPPSKNGFGGGLKVERKEVKRAEK
jgi:transposase